MGANDVVRTVYLVLRDNLRHYGSPVRAKRATLNPP